MKDPTDGKVYISSQNHGYAVDAGSMEQGIAEELFVNVNDGTNEGLRYKGKKDHDGTVSSGSKPRTSGYSVAL